jgi:hypothetical protein
VGTLVVVVVDERVQERLQLVDRGRLDGLGSEPFLEGLLESLDFALGGRVVGFAVLLGDVESLELGFEGVASALAAEAGEADGEDEASRV